MNKLLLIGFLFLVALPVNAQKKTASKAKVPDKQGTLFFYWGYNRSFYTKSDIRFQGNGYDFMMGGARAHDNPEKLSWNYLNPAKITIPQFNIRMGYYIKNNWVLSLGYDHMKYIFADRNHVRLNGYIEPGLDNVSNLSGEYNDAEIVTDREEFHYENSDGLNYIRVELARSYQWYETRSGWFGLSTTVGLSAGTLLSFNDFRFAGQNDKRTISLSGYGLSAHLGLRFEFFQHLFLQANYGGGFMHQVGVKTRPNDAAARASQKFGFMEMNAVIGALFYIKQKNNCNSCPSW